MAATIIGPSLVLEGEITGTDDVVISGTVKGGVACGARLRIEDSAEVEADLEGSVVSIGGHLSGSVQASEKVELGERSRVLGDIKTPRVLIADGATFKGSIDMSR